jgi:hypothetical protein
MSDRNFEIGGRREHYTEQLDSSCATAPFIGLQTSLWAMSDVNAGIHHDHR